MSLCRNGELWNVRELAREICNHRGPETLAEQVERATALLEPLFQPKTNWPSEVKAIIELRALAEQFSIKGRAVIANPDRTRAYEECAGSLINLAQEFNRAAPSLHKEGPDAQLMYETYEQYRERLHKEGAGGEPLNEIDLVRAVLCAHQTAYAKAHNGEGRSVMEAENIAIGYASVELAKLLAQRAEEPPPLQRTLPDEQFKGVVVEPMSAPEERLREALELYLRTYADTQTHPTVVEEANCINVARSALAASPAGRAEQVLGATSAGKDGEAK